MLILRSKLISKPFLSLRFYKSQLKNIQSLTDPLLIQKANKIQEAKPDYNKLLDFDPEMLSQVPWIFKPLEPFIDSAKDLLLTVNQSIGLPWPAVIIMSCVFIRLTILPLMYVQIKRVSKIAPLSPVFIHLKDAFKSSNWGFVKKSYTSIQAFRTILIDQNLNFMRTFIFNIIHFPIIITMIYTIRKLIAEPQVGSYSLLHLPSLTAADPYCILPALTICLHYFNFQRFITKQNSHTILSRIRSICQVLLLLWFPWLCSWPSGIVLYMLTNAFLSSIQISAMMHPKVSQMMNPRMIYYGYILNKVEYDQKSSLALSEQIKTGNENLKISEISEQKVEQKARELIKHMNSSLHKLGDSNTKSNSKQDNQKQG